MLLFYALMKVSCGWVPKPLYPPEKPSKTPGHGFDPSPVTGRIEQLRHDYSPELHHRPDGFKRELRLTACREALRAQPFFNKETADELTAEPQS
ncbi:hypothetical protein [Pedosphaera parvula]|nr:hypothetical protein [Pedosphaera parvula]